MFREFGELESVSIPKDERGEYKEHGFVCFKNCDDAERAAEALNKKTLGSG